VIPHWRLRDLNYGNLSDYFEGVGVKTLSAVDANPARSNQHEIGTTAAMRRFLSEDKRTFPTVYLWIGGEQESISAEGSATHYDTREKQPHRSPEWRLYYDSNPVTGTMKTGDTLFLARRPDGSLLFIVTPPDSSIRNQLLWLFGFHTQPKLRFEVNEISGDDDAELDFAARRILDEIGIEYEDPNANSFDEIIERFGTKFPSTAEFSQLARLTLPHVDARDDPDGALLAWLNQEEAMFRRLEQRVMADRLAEGFEKDGVPDVDGFVSYSLSVQNRRKSRMGLSLENHLEAVFSALKIRFQTQAPTEQGNTVDFLFPSSAQYHDDSWIRENLVMLAAKASCKDRWRQVLAEADKIKRKHLVTLEPAISPAQTSQMRAADLQLVIPKRLHESYNAEQRTWIWSLSDFVDFVRDSEVRWNNGRNWLPLVDFIKSLELGGLDLSRDSDNGRDVEL
jgi:hypothetical protein